MAPATCIDEACYLPAPKLGDYCHSLSHNCNNSACTYSSQQTIPGVCMPYVELGGRCNADPGCDPQLHCDQQRNLCVRKPSHGQPCGDGCIAGDFCDQGICQLLGATGDACSPGECGAGECDAGRCALSALACGP